MTDDDLLTLAACGGRPRGEIRTALAGAAQALHAECGGATWRQMAARACVGYDKARATVQDMRRAGELQPVDTVPVPGARRPMVRYAPGHNWVTNWGGASTARSIDSVLQGWLR